MIELGGGLIFGEWTSKDRGVRRRFKDRVPPSTVVAFIRLNLIIKTPIHN